MRTKAETTNMPEDTEFYLAICRNGRDREGSYELESFVRWGDMAKDFSHKAIEKKIGKETFFVLKGAKQALDFLVKHKAASLVCRRKRFILLVELNESQASPYELRYGGFELWYK